jgi:FlaG/FlaF family flagellin (archaellin)
LVFLTVKFIFLFNSFLDMSRGRLGISPVVATVILVAVAIVIAIAVAFWASGLVGIFTRFEKLEIRSAVANPDGAGGYNVKVVIVNTGSSPATIDEVYINGQPAANFVGVVCDGGAVSDGNPATGAPVDVGQQVQIQCNLPAGAPFVPGVTIEFMVHSASGKQYPTAILLP